jgi:hypothetical protein
VNFTIAMVVQCENCFGPDIGHFEAGFESMGETGCSIRTGGKETFRSVRGSQGEIQRSGERNRWHDWKEGMPDGVDTIGNQAFEFQLDASLSVLISVLSGFVFIAPLLAFGLYSVSRQLCEGKTPELGRTLLAIRRPFSNSLVYTLVLLVIFLLWARAGMMVQVFFPFGGDPEWDHILVFLLIGSTVGSIFASVSFAASVFSLPMLANRDIDVITAVISSINAVLRNKPAMVVWAFLICALTLVGFLTAGIGLIIIIPWLAYATWHGYRAALDVSEWGILPRTDAE